MKILKSGTRKALVVSCIVGIYCLKFDCPVASAQPPALATDAPKQQLIVVVGAPGTDEYKAEFYEWAARWKIAAARADAVSMTIGTDDNPVTDLERLCTAVNAAAVVETVEPLWIVFLGHGTFDGRIASLNLRGPDISSETAAELLQAAKRPIAFIACASCTAPFLNALSAPDRIVISATKDGNQVQYSRFGDAMSRAIGGLDADINRDGQTSLLEAWLFASRRTSEFYTTEGRLATEHSLLDDNGDGKGTRAEVYEADRQKPNIQNADQLDGSKAAHWHLIRSNDERQFTSDQLQTRNDLEQRLEELRQRRDELAEIDYLFQLESILVPLARLYESVEASAMPAEIPKE